MQLMLPREASSISDAYMILTVGLLHCMPGAGEVAGFWMTKIKDRAYVVYASEAQAEATRNALSGLEWPLGNGNSLRPKCAPSFVCMAQCR